MPGPACVPRRAGATRPRSLARRATATADAPDGSKAAKAAPQGPHCVRPTAGDVNQLEEAKEEYHSGRAIVDDAHFDAIERRLRVLDSAAVVRGPRCSLRGMRVYSDAVPDSEQMANLAILWSAIGGGAALAAIGGIVSLSRIPDDGLAAVPGAAFAALIAATMGTTAVSSLQRIGEGRVAALRGSCPACGEELYAFVDPPRPRPEMCDKQPEVDHPSECHVCGASVVFMARRLDAASPSLHGRIYLKARGRSAEDYA